MSTHEQKLEVIAEFLCNRARLGRVTNVREIQMCAAEGLCAKGYRDDLYPVDRDKVHAVLDELAKLSFEAEGFILPVIVAHFWDNEPGGRFVRWAGEAGLIDLDAAEDPAATKTLYLDQLAKVFVKYQEMEPVPYLPTESSE